MGIWSLLLSFTGVSNIGGLGFPLAVVSLVARQRSTGNPKELARLIETALTSVATSVAILSAVVLFLLYPFLSSLVSAGLLHEARALLPSAAGVGWLMGVSLVSQSVLDGLQRSDERSRLTIATTVGYAVAAATLAKLWGLHGVAAAAAGQYAVLLVTTVMRIRRYAPIRRIPRTFDVGQFRKLVRFGAGFQLVGLVSLMVEPTVKLALARNASLASVTFFDMATKAVGQMRSLIVNANRALIPVFAELDTVAPKRVAELYVASFRTVLFLSFCLYVPLGIAAGDLSMLWLGRSEPGLEMMLGLVSMGSFLSTIGAPAYFAFLGRGQPAWCVRADMTIAVTAVALGWSAGHFWGAEGVMSGWIIGRAAGTLLLVTAWKREGVRGAGQLLKGADVRLLAAAVGVLGVSCVVTFDGDAGQVALLHVVVICTAAVALFGIAGWGHDVPLRIVRWVKNRSWSVKDEPEASALS